MNIQKLWRRIALAAVVIGLVANCTSENEPEAVATASQVAEPEEAAVSEESAPKAAGGPLAKDAPPAEPATSDRGLMIKTIGESAGLHRDNDREAVMASFTIDAIEVDPQCVEQYPGSIESPENGHFVMVSITATVEPGFSQWMQNDMEAYGVTGLSFNTYEFGLVDANGLTVNEPATFASFSCVGEDLTMPMEVRDGETATGVIVLDSPTPTGVLTYRPYFMNGNGWEWEF